MENALDFLRAQFPEFSGLQRTVQRQRADLFAVQREDRIPTRGKHPLYLMILPLIHGDAPDVFFRQLEPGRQARRTVCQREPLGEGGDVRRVRLTVQHRAVELRDVLLR